MYLKWLVECYGSPRVDSGFKCRYIIRNGHRNQSAVLVTLSSNDSLYPNLRLRIYVLRELWIWFNKPTTPPINQALLNQATSTELPAESRPSLQNRCMQFSLFNVIVIIAWLCNPMYFMVLSCDTCHSNMSDRDNLWQFLYPHCTTWSEGMSHTSFSLLNTSAKTEQLEMCRYRR